MSVNRQLNQTVRVSGTGDTPSQAFADALGKVKQAVLGKSSDIYLRIEPIDVTVLSAVQKKETEYFLFFFLPREKQHFSVDLQVEVQVQYISLAEVRFNVQEEKRSPHFWVNVKQRFLKEG
ncbi:DUF4312 family protein [Vagococcus acidifermentans]|uniref:Cytoplasmic protein n=1 Tax=Vagococcus acidifermentans TaxID=564710 RepID=A0A430B0F1_9ENTE|nr:DUF4312 family protein [Vagococcus acidifermentans]RSU13823.1 hypothetical protein CBF27_02680 [Vagococcus acidifermentans]